MHTRNGNESAEVLIQLVESVNTHSCNNGRGARIESTHLLEVLGNREDRVIQDHVSHPSGVVERAVYYSPQHHLHRRHGGKNDQSRCV